ncbi:MAG: MFS transporter [Proteobacteria bacterium]|nr:MFS transporter [Pseudomonadota bacterium]
MPAVWLLSCYWFFALAGLGIFLPYYSLYLRENAGLPGSQVGLVMATVPLMGIVAPAVWGQVADLSGQRTRVMAVLALGTAAGYTALTLPGAFAEFLIATALLAACSTALFPAATSVSLGIVAERRIPFGHVRVWGTVGYLASVVAFPWALHAFGKQAPPDGPSEPSLGAMFASAGALLVVASGFVLLLPRTGSVALRARRGDLPVLLRNGPYLRVLAITFGAHLFLRGPMALFPLYVRAHGGTMDTVSQMWIWMIALEIPLVAGSGTVARRVSPRGLLVAGVLAGGLRWTLSGLADDLVWVYPAQLLHGLSVTGLIVGAPLCVDALVPARLRSTAQGLLVMIGGSLGGVLSSSSAGWALEHLGADAPALIGGTGALMVGCLAPLLLPSIGAQAPAGGGRPT